MNADAHKYEIEDGLCKLKQHFHDNYNEEEDSDLEDRQLTKREIKAQKKLNEQSKEEKLVKKLQEYENKL